jgi:DNA-binding MarR family transcriptional regulator
LWLRCADNAITARTNEALSALRLTRIHWQALNTIHTSGRITPGQLHTGLQDFVDEAGLERLLRSFQDRGWLNVHASGFVELTDAGTRGREDALAIQAQVRDRTMRGISEQDYLTVLRVLQAIVKNLE